LFINFFTAVEKNDEAALKKIGSKRLSNYSREIGEKLLSQVDRSR
jgi:hypothetical protein